MRNVTIGILLLVITSVCVAAPFKEIPRPVAGPSLLAALSSESELDHEAVYQKYEKKKLRQVRHRYVLGEKQGLDQKQLNEIYDLVLAATAVDGPQSLCILEPRHYFTYTSEYGLVEVLMCFECGEAIINVNDWSTRRSLGRTFQAKINAILEKHGVPLPVTK
jgi:hypothetical protein